VIFLIELKSLIDTVLDLILVDINLKYGCTEITKAVVYERLS
jgi:hypothetical protein